MTSTRHAIVALFLPLGLGAAVLANTSRPLIALPALIALLAFVGFECWAFNHAQRVATRQRWEAQKQSGYPLWSATGDRDRLWEQLGRRRVR